MERILRSSSQPMDYILDPFLGSGSMLMACEALNRTCWGVDIAPQYIAVTLQRWADMTGETPHLAG